MGSEKREIMSSEFNFGGGNAGLRARCDAGAGQDGQRGCSFKEIAGHGMQDHHYGLHDQINLFQEGVKDSGMNFRFFKSK